MTSLEYRTNLEQKTVDLIERELRNRKMNAARARDIARHVLTTLQENMTLDQIYHRATSLDADFNELIEVALPVTQEYDTKMKERVVPHVHKLIDEGQIDQARTVMKQANRREIPVTHYE